MRIIDLLNKIAKGEEVPKKIKYINSIWEYNEKTKDYNHDDLWLFYGMNGIGLTESKIEILEEENKIEKLKNRYTKQAIDNYKLANFNSNDMESICKSIGFLMENSNISRDKIDEIIDVVNKLKEKQ